MVTQKATQENPMPAIDEGWWASVLAEESRVSSRVAGNHRGEVGSETKPAPPYAAESARIDWWRASCCLCLGWRHTSGFSKVARAGFPCG